MDRIVDIFNDYYIVNRYKYIVSWPGLHGYITQNYYKNNKNNSCKPLTDWLVKQHLQHKQTVGIFAGCKDKLDISKFLCFDIDAEDTDIIDAIVDQLRKDDIYDFALSTSGGKGWHIDVFFDAPVSVSVLERYYWHVLHVTGLDALKHGSNQVVEMRPTYGHAVKLPLGRNFNSQKDDNICHYYDYNTMTPVDIDAIDGFFAHIEKIDAEWFAHFVGSIKDKKSDTEKASEIKQNYKQPAVYDVGVDEQVTIEDIQHLETTGLTATGMRHNSLFKLAKYYKWCGLERQDCHDVLVSWMQQQSKNIYTTPWDDVLKDIQSIVDYVYDKDCTLTITAKDISVSAAEMRQILQLKTKNQRLIMYAMLVHSKRYATKLGYFFFPLRMLSDATGIGSADNLHTLINAIRQLETADYITVQRAENRGKQTPHNTYRITMPTVATDNNSYTVHDAETDYAKSMVTCIITLIPIADVRKLCGRRYAASLQAA